MAKRFLNLAVLKYAGAWLMAVLAFGAMMPSGLTMATGEQIAARVPSERDAQNDILYYDQDECAEGEGTEENAKNQTCVGDQCSAGVLPGDSNEEIVWNYFAQAGISGVSDNPAVIAGIIGNMKNEAIDNPFCRSNGTGCNTGDTYHGIYGESNPGLKEEIDAAGLGRYWGWSSSNIPVEAIKKAIKIELDFLTQKNPRWMGGCISDDNCWDENLAFMPNLDNVDNTGLPESYADLFMVTVEGCWPGGSGSVEDTRVQKIANIKWDIGDWQLAKERREAAREVYDKYAGTGATLSGSNSGFSTTDTLSGTANQKYTASKEELTRLLNFALWKDETNYKDILSSILDDFEKNNSDKKGDTDALMAYVEEGGEFRYRSDDDNFATLSIDRTVTSEQDQAVHNIVNEGKRTTTAETAQVTTGEKSGANYCADGKSKKGVGAARIAEVAALMSWPVQGWQSGKADDYQPNREGRCDGGGGNWVPYEFDTEPCMSNPRDFYKDNVTPGVQGWLDCGVFVMGVLHYLDLVGTDGTSGGQPYAGQYFRSHADEWSEISASSEADLQPGDIIWDENDTSKGGKGFHGHIIIYVGEQYGGEFGRVAHASANTRVGEIGAYNYDLSEWAVFRYVGDKLGGAGGDCGQYSGGEAVACVAEYMAWPATDEGWSKAMSGVLTDEYVELRDKWFGPNDGSATGGQANDVSCARFASLAILESGADPGFQVTSPPSRSNIRWIGSSAGDGLEGYLSSSPNWERVTNGQYEKGDVLIRSGNSGMHVLINMGGGLIAEGAGDSGNNTGNNDLNRSGVMMQGDPASYVQSGYSAYRVKE